MLNDNQKPTTANQNPPADDMPPIMMEDTHPPMMNDNSQVSIANGQTSTPSAVDNKPSTDTGSAAPADDIVMPSVVTSGPNTGKIGKKFGGGKVIATILGLFLLIGGAGAGVLLVQQNQDIREQALNACVCKNANGVNAGNGTCVSNGTTSWCECDSPLEVKTDNCRVTEGYGGVDPNITQQELNQRCLFLSGQIANDAGQTCGPNGTSCTAEFASDCSNWSPPSGTTTTTPTNPPVISAVCQDVKAYSETWTLLTTTQLSQLKTGDKVNFCVTGTASSGSFNKARFTINGTLQAETTTVRPGSTDFCQLYNIPVGVTTFNVTAQINHATLGWK